MSPRILLCALLLIASSSSVMAANDSAPTTTSTPPTISPDSQPGALHLSQGQHQAPTATDRRRKSAPQSAAGSTGRSGHDVRHEASCREGPCPEAAALLMRLRMPSCRHTPRAQ